MCVKNSLTPRGNTVSGFWCNISLFYYCVREVSVWVCVCARSTFGILLWFVLFFVSFLHVTEIFLVVLLCCCIRTQWAVKITHTQSHTQGRFVGGGVRWEWGSMVVFGGKARIFAMVTCMGLCRCVTGVCGLWIQTKQTHTLKLTHTRPTYTQMHGKEEVCRYICMYMCISIRINNYEFNATPIRHTHIQKQASQPITHTQTRAHTHTHRYAVAAAAAAGA